MKRFYIITGFAIITITSGFLIKSSNKQSHTIHAILNSQEYNISVVDYYDSLAYSSLTLLDKDGNNITMSCWFCDFDSFTEAATKHLKKRETN